MRSNRWFALACMVLFGASVSAGAQSAKNAVAISDLKACSVSASKLVPGSPVNGAWTNVLKASLHTSQQKDLNIGLSLQCGLTTDTSVVSSGGTKDTTGVEALIEVQVLVDGKVLGNWPYSGPSGPVTMARRAQTLWAQLQGIVAIDPTTGGLVITAPEAIGLILDTMDANHFDWVVANVGVGDHTVSANARAVLTCTQVTNGNAAAAAYLGWGTLTVEEIRLIKDATPLTP